MLDLNKPVQTRDGLRVKVLTKDSGDPKYPVVGLLYRGDGEVSPETWTKDGRWTVEGHGDGYNLVNVPEENTYFINISADGGTGFAYGSLSEARIKGGSSAVAIIKVRMVDGRVVAVGFHPARA